MTISINSANRFKSYGLLCLLLLSVSFAQAQDTAATTAKPVAQKNVRIEGKVVDPTDPMHVFQLVVVNQRTSLGYFGASTGNFSIEAFRSDTLKVGAIGYTTVAICMKDSAPKEQYYVEIQLQRLKEELQEVEVIAPKELEDIKKDIEALGYDKSDYMLDGVAAMQSPITLLYQMFSRKEKEKRAYAELVNEANRNKVMQELLRICVNADIVYLSEKEFDEFIGYCNVTDAFLKSSSEYELLAYLKQRFDDFQVWKGINYRELYGE